MSGLCLCLTGATLTDNIHILQKYRAYIGCYELRVDLLDSIEPPAIAHFPQRIAQELETEIPGVLTYRRVADGGHYRGSEERRLEIMLEIIEQQTEAHSYRYIDIEYAVRSLQICKTLIDHAKWRAIDVIYSMHDMEGGASKTYAHLKALSQNRAVIPKLAVTLKGLADVVTLCRQWARYQKSQAATDRKAIIVGMGEYGVPLRILAPKLGSFISYCSATERTQAASGQLDPTMLYERYRYNYISPQTRLFGIIGNPLQHTQSPQWHNRIFERRNLNARYLPFLCDNVAAFFELAELLSIEGVSVTIPHKQAVLPWLNKRDATVIATRASNTLVRRPEGWQGYNTDCHGFWQPLRQLLKKHVRTLPSHALIIGAGGVARAAASELLKRDVALAILNRTLAKATTMCNELLEVYPNAQCHTYVLPQELDQIQHYTALIVQTTSVGMHPHSGVDPLEGYHFTGKELVYDLIYHPRETALLKRAQAAGCIALGGYPMFRAQAQAQSKHFLQSYS